VVACVEGIPWRTFNITNVLTNARNISTEKGQLITASGSAPLGAQFSIIRKANLHHWDNAWRLKLPMGLGSFRVWTTKGSWKFRFPLHSLNFQGVLEFSGFELPRGLGRFWCVIRNVAELCFLWCWIASYMISKWCWIASRLFPIMFVWLTSLWAWLLQHASIIPNTCSNHA